MGSGPKPMDERAKILDRRDGMATHQLSIPSGQNSSIPKRNTPIFTMLKTSCRAVQDTTTKIIVMKNMIALSLGLFIYGISCAQEFSGDIATQIKDVLRTMPDQFEISVGLYTKGTTQGYGFRFTDGEVVAQENTQHLFEIGSITKTFTATLLMQKVQEGTITLDSPIHTYLNINMKTSTFQGHYISFRHLVTHTSGLSNSAPQYLWPFLKAKMIWPQNPYKYIKAKHYDNYLKKFELTYVPGRTWSYNNSAFALLGHTIASLSNQTWESLVQEKILSPFDMTHTYIDVPEQKKGALITGHSAKGKKASLWDMDFINPAGVLKSNVNDMLKWIKINVSSTAPGFIQATHASADIDIPSGSRNTMGIGWIHKTMDNGDTYLWHSGGTGGYHAFIAFTKAHQNGIVILTNFSGKHPAMRNEQDKNKIIQLGFEILTKLTQKHLESVSVKVE